MGLLHPRHQLVHAEGLGDVVVRAGVERGDLLRLDDASRQDDDGHAGRFAKTAADLGAIQVWQAKVEKLTFGADGSPKGTEPLDRLMRPGRCLRVNDAQHLRPDFLE